MSLASALPAGGIATLAPVASQHQSGVATVCASITTKPAESAALQEG